MPQILKAFRASASSLAHVLSFALAATVPLLGCGSTAGANGTFAAIVPGAACFVVEDAQACGAADGVSSRMSCKGGVWVQIEACAGGTCTSAGAHFTACAAGPGQIADSVAGEVVDSGAGDGGADDGGDGASASDTGRSNDSGIAGDGIADGPCACLQPDVWFRFDKLTLDSIDLAKHNVQIALNPLWKKDIDAFELNLYAHVVAANAAEVTLEIVNGARVAGTKSDVCLLPTTKVKVILPRSGCSLLPSAPMALNIYAGTSANPKNCAPVNEVKHSIPVRGAVLQSTVAADCSRMDDGLVSEGHLPASALAVTCTCLTTGNQNSEACGVPDATYVSDKNDQGEGCDGCNGKFQNLNNLLNTFGELSYKCKEGDEKAACLTASFAAARIDGPPPVCGGL